MMTSAWTSSITARVCRTARRTRPGSREFVMAAGEMSVDQFTTFLSNALTGIASVTKDVGFASVCMHWRHLRELEAARQASAL